MKCILRHRPSIKRDVVVAFQAQAVEDAAPRLNVLKLPKSQSSSLLGMEMYWWGLINLRNTGEVIKESLKSPYNTPLI